jgi:hypothetical protein
MQVPQITSWIELSVEKKDGKFCNVEYRDQQKFPLLKNYLKYSVWIQKVTV